MWYRGVNCGYRLIVDEVVYRVIAAMSAQQIAFAKQSDESARLVRMWFRPCDVPGKIREVRTHQNQVIWGFVGV